jgi:hypothetical protein
MEFCLMTAACLAKHFVSEVVVVPQFHFGSNFHSRHCFVQVAGQPDHGRL